jgi:4-hydroxybenzoate polyprenyltransferase
MLIGSIPLSTKLKAWLFTLERYFALPFFGGSLFLGVALNHGNFGSLNVWLAFIVGIALMCGGHVWNSVLDYAWVKLDKGEVEDRSAEKTYTGGQNLIENKIVSVRETAIVAVVWDIIAFIIAGYLISRGVSWLFIIFVVIGALIPFWYSVSKFNYTHELCLGIACGPLPAIIGSLAVNGSPPWVNVLLVSIPCAIVLSFAGLALDEFPDASANLKKGVKSLAYEVWKWSDWIPTIGEKSLSTLQWYLTGWFLFMFFYQGLLIQLNILKPLTGLAFLTFPFLMACMLKMTSNFKKWAAIIVIVGALYVILLLVGQIVG